MQCSSGMVGGLSTKETWGPWNYCKVDVTWVKLVWSLYDQGAPHAQSPRGSFWWRDIFSLVNDYRSITTIQIGNGQSSLFWKDFWSNGHNLCDQFPQLYSFALNEDVTVADMAIVPDLSSFFALPMSVEAHDELMQVHVLLDGILQVDGHEDIRSFVWGGDRLINRPSSINLCSL
jgi:hypothetical protein